MSRLNFKRRCGVRATAPFVALAVATAFGGASAFFAFAADDEKTPQTASSAAPAPDAAAPVDVVSETVVVQEPTAPQTPTTPTTPMQTPSEKRRSLLSPEDEKTFDALVDLYVYAFPLVLSREIQRETTSNLFFASTNETAYFPRTPNARYRATELPNVDSLLAVAWLDLNQEAQIVVMPAEPREAFDVEIIDAWTNVVASFDGASAAERFPTLTVGGRAVRAFALVGPTTPKPENLPPEVGTLESPSDLALVWTRVFLGAAAYRGAAATRPVVRTLYEFETFPLSVFLAETKLDSALEKDVRQDAAPEKNGADSNLTGDVQALDARVDATLKSVESTESNAVDALETEETSELNAELTPSNPIDSAANSNVAARYAAAILDDDKDKDDKDDAKNKDGKDAEKTDDKDGDKDDAKSLRERFDETVERGERDLEAGTKEARQYASGLWRDVRENGREALDSVDAFYERTARKLRDEFGRAGRDWDEFDAELDADWARFVRERRTFRPTRRWFERPVERLERTNPETFLKTFAELLKTNPPTAADAPIVESMKTLGIVPGQPLREIDPRVRRLAPGAFAIARNKIEIASYSQIWRNATSTNWVVLKNLGDYGTDYLLRAGVASVFIGANVEKNAVYPFAFLDANGDPLDGESGAYRVRFAAGQTPPTDFLWSLTLYDGDRYLYPNRWDKHAVRGDAPLVYNPDGSLDVLIQRDEPKENPVNWIPAPRGRFVLTLRVYRPKASVLNGDWIPPAVEKLEREPAAK